MCIDTFIHIQEEEGMTHFKSTELFINAVIETTRISATSEITVYRKATDTRKLSLEPFSVIRVKSRKVDFFFLYKKVC